MTQFAKGGRGKEAPYKTTHHRIPEPCKTTVKLLSDTYKYLREDEREGEDKTEKLLTDVQNLITMHYLQEFDKPVNDYVYKHVQDIGESNVKTVNKLLGLLHKAVSTDGRRVNDMRRIISEAIALLEQEMQ